MNTPEEWPPYELKDDERKALFRQLEAMSVAEIEEKQALDAQRFGDECEDPASKDATERITRIARQHGFPVDVLRQGLLAGCQEFWRWRLLENRSRENPIPLGQCHKCQYSVSEVERLLEGVKARVELLPTAPEFDFPAIRNGLQECKAALKCASYDQRTVLAAGSRRDLRLAAAALIQTVAAHAEKNGRKGRPNLTEFLFQALWLIDRSVTYRLVEDLDKSAFVVSSSHRPEDSSA